MFTRKAQEDKAATETKTEQLTFYDAGKEHDLMELYPQNKELFAALPAERGRDLHRGAVAAFRDGHPENIQTLLANPDLFRLGIPAHQTLCALAQSVEEIEDKAAIILLSIEKLPEEKRQKFLDKTLSDIFSTTDYYGEEPFVTALVAAGADANAVISGASGQVMAMAVTNGYPQSVIRLLHEQGAKFEDALLHIETKPFWDKDNRRDLAVHKLKTYREAITGEPAVEEGDILKEIRKLHAEIAALRDEITGRLPAEGKTPAPEPAASTAVSKARKPKSAARKPSP